MEQVYFEGYNKLGSFSEELKKIIELYEAQHQLYLPAAYVEFVCRNGDVYLDFWFHGGCDTNFQIIDIIIRISKEELSAVGADIGDFFPFANYSGSQFFFFYLTDGDNPPVHKFDSDLFYYEPAVDGLPKGVIKWADTFTEFVYKVSKNYI